MFLSSTPAILHIAHFNANFCADSNKHQSVFLSSVYIFVTFPAQATYFMSNLKNSHLKVFVVLMSGEQTFGYSAPL